MPKVLTTYQMTLLDGRVATFDALDRLFLPRFLKGRGIQNYEPVSTAAFMAACEVTNGAVFDVGANIGLYTLAASSALRKKVVAFEPFGPAATVLKSIARACKLDVRVIGSAVADKPGRIEFYLSKKSDMSNSLNKNFRNHRKAKVITTTTIDAYARKYRPSVIKIDTETTEMQVLKGALKTIERDRPYVMLEILGKEQKQEFTAFFSSFGYTPFRLGGRRLRRQLVDISDLDGSGDRRNWIFLPDEPADDMIGRMNAWLEKLRTLPVAPCEEPVS